MNSYERARAYVLQGPTVQFTPRQQRRFKRKLRPEQDAIIEQQRASAVARYEIAEEAFLAKAYGESS